LISKENSFALPSARGREVFPTEVVAREALLKRAASVEKYTDEIGGGIAKR
jgi:hypothetical protein